MGTLAWGRQGGRLTRTERWRFALDGAIAVLGARWPRRRGSAGALGRIDRIDIARPTTPESRRAEQLLEETSPGWLVGHGYRTYAFGLAFAAAGGLRPDRELLYCASLLHDLGLVPLHLPLPGGCFALSGAEAAREALEEVGMAPGRAAIVAEAIALHLNLVVTLGDGVEAHLLRRATAFEITGQGGHVIPRAFTEAVVREHPRTDFKREVALAIRAQAERSPDTRIGFLCRTLDLPRRVEAAPLPDAAGDQLSGT